MTLRLDDKKAIVADVRDKATQALALVVTEYRGLTVEQMTKLRAQARSAGVYLRVVRNTLARRAVEGTAFDCIKEALTGPLLLAFSQQEASAAARLIRDFAKEYQNLVVRALAFDGQLMAANDLNKMASLPTRNEALSLLMSVMKAPITKLVRTIAEPHAKLTRTLAAVREQRGAA